MILRFLVRAHRQHCGRARDSIRRAAYPPWILGLLCFVCASLLPGCLDYPDAELRVGTIVWPGYEPLFLARSLGYYDHAPIKLVEYPSATEVIRAFENRTIDAAALTGDEVLRLAVNEQEPQIVLVMDYSAGADAILGRNEILDLAMLRDRRVGMEPNALGAYMLTRGLEFAGLQAKDVHVQPLRIFETEEALQQGSVDAVVTFEPYRTRLLARGARVLFDSSRIPGEIFDVLCVRKALLKQGQPSLQVLVDGWFKALDYLQREPTDATKRIAARENISPEQLQAALRGIQIPSRADNQAMLTADGSSLQQGVDKLMGVMLEHGLIPRRVDIGSLFDASLVANPQQ